MAGPNSTEPAFHAALAALPIAVYGTDPAGWITFFNVAAVELWGRRPRIGDDRWCGSWRMWTLDRLPLPHDQCPMAVAIKENRPVRNVQALAERPDGSFVRFAPFPTPIQDQSGDLIGAINVLLDVTALNQGATLSQDSALSNRLALLTPRERDVLSGIGSGGSNKAIARALGISPRTVEVHRRNLMAKLEVHSVAEMVRASIKPHN